MSLPPLVNETWYALRLGASNDDPSVVVDLSRGVVLAVGKGALKGALRDACNKPLVAKPRRPKLVQVASDEACKELRGCMPGVTVELAPVPEVVELRAQAHLRHQAPPAGGPATWGYSPGVFEDVLSLGEELLEVEPWALLTDSDPLTIRAPDHGIDEGVLLVLGNAGQQFGFLVFPTRELAEEFRALSSGPRSKLFRSKLSGPYFAFNFEGPEFVTAPMRTAARRAGFEGQRYPLPLSVSPDLQFAIAGEAVSAMLVAAGRALVELAVYDAESIAGGVPALSEHDGVILLFHGIEQPSAEVVAIGGGPVDAPSDDAGASWRADDFALLQRLTALADESLGPAWRANAAHLDSELGAPAHGLLLWPALLESRGPSTALAELRQRHPDLFDARTEAILAAEAVTWNGLWEVKATLPGEGFDARDLLTHEVRFVSDVSASRSLRAGTVLCARIPTIGEESWIAAADGHGLSPYQADQVRTELAEQQGWPKTRAVPIGKVLAARAQRDVALSWRQAVAGAMDAPAPRVVSKHGETLVMVEDIYRISRPDMTKVEGAERTTGDGPRRPGGLPSDGPPWCVKTGDGPLAQSDVDVQGDGLRVRSLSIAQADRTRARLEAAFGEALAHVERQTRNLSDEAAARGWRGGGLQAVPSEAEQEAVLKHKASHYASWPDVPLPALDGKTPRAAAKQKRSRVRLERLIDDMQHHEQMSPPGTRYDFDLLRRDLGLID